MADIKPFVCVRPAEDVVSAVAALPYDVFNREEAKEVVAKNPKSFLAIDRAETQFPDDVDTYDDRVYAKAAQMLKDWIADGTFIRDNRECYYIYELTMDGRTQTGIAACASIDDYANQVIKKHENTRADKEQDRICHVDTCSAQTGPIFLAYRANAVINEVVAKTKKQDALYDFVAEDGIRHRVFVISDPEDIKTIRNAFAQIGEIYIADGHHRSAAAALVGAEKAKQNPNHRGDEEYNYFMAVCFPANQLTIIDYNRVVKDLNGMTPEQFLTAVSKNFTVEEKGTDIYKPAGLHNFSLYLDGKWYSLTAKPGTYNDNDPIGVLDVTISSNLILDEILGIKDLRSDKRIDFVGGIRGLGELKKRVDSGEMKVALALYPVSMKQLMDIADTGNIMPPKTTWFEPKLRSGLVIHKLD